MKYLISVNPLGGITIFNSKTSSWIPCDENNPDYCEYLEWVAEGNEAQTWE